MSQESDNEALLRSAYAAWRDSNGADVDSWVGIMDEAGTYGSLLAGRGVKSTAPVTGRAALRQTLESLTAEWAMISYDMPHFVCQGDRVAVKGGMAWRHRASGKEVETPKADFWRLKDGKAVEFFEFYDTAKMLSALPDAV